MGRLLGIVGLPPLSARQVLTDFYSLAGPSYPHGWGVSGFNNGRAVYFGRSAEPAAATRPGYELAMQKAEKSQTAVVVAHFRKAGDGQSDMSRVHPFHHRDWVFAHDGSIARPGDLPLVDVGTPQGQTDSERLLHWLLEKIVPADDPTAALAEGIQELKEKMEFTALTFLLSEGTQLWAYREAKDKNATLFWTQEAGKSLICSEPLAPVARWKDIPQKKLALFTPSQPAPQFTTL